MSFWAVKIEFSWSPSMALPWTRCGEGNLSSLRLQLPLTFNFFCESLLKINSNPVTMSEWKTIYNLCLISNIERFLLQVGRASYINQVRTPPVWTPPFTKLNSLTFQVSVSHYSICTCSILLSFPLTF